MQTQSTATTPLEDNVQVTNNAGYAVLKTLRNYGIDTIFGIPGTHNLEFYRHLAPLGIHPVTTRHEQGAGYGADGWAQQKGLPGVVITTSGPGLLNALSAAGTAYCESRPLIILSPGVPEGEEFADIGSLHETKDSTAAAGAIVQWSRRVHSATEAVAAVHDAFEIFRYGRPRPVHIEVPLNILESLSDCPEDLLQARPRRQGAQADATSLATAVQLLKAAQNPVILAGGGSIPAGAALAALAEALQAPVVTTLNGKGAVPESHPLALGSDIRLPAAQQLCNRADVLLVIGSKVGESELWGGNITPSGPVIRVDILASQANKNLASDLALIGDSAAIVTQLLHEIGSPERPVVNLAPVREELRNQARALSPELSRIAEEAAAVLPSNTIVGGDSSQITYLGTASFIPQEFPHSFLYTPAYATLGYGLPASIGAKIAAPERPVVCIVGDGALMFAVQELITAVEQRLDLVVVCVDNGGYAEIRSNEADRGIPAVGVDLVQPNWAALATAFGGTGHAITRAADFAPTLHAALQGRGLHVLHVPVSLFNAAS
ncbi:thiamine pyrophosphate-binding protein [Arthrobacter psychrochitiniphilus]|uniref:Acetolactate synthase n=1 Tax=Arthrobacter psychrochitiniphilus TaxID=291045 RepID=A0A2V3E0I3_9MICC|nr:thiamine pyrophosphate-binding protein [Arthrobacter psychrochitiniphilus]NYG15784.1 acetolactate synthase-1/2/3 large subunit [Arthrobacter psychrochitiniphilus]PXA66763.1 acetolactate synthase [Arthrobacter psychrochitiniphilus]